MLQPLNPDYKPFDLDESMALTERRREISSKRPIDWEASDKVSREEEIMQMRFTTDWWRKLFLDRLEKRRLLYAHGAISMPEYSSPIQNHAYTSGVLMDDGLVFVSITHDRGGREHWFIPYSASFRVRHEGRGFSSPFGTAISNAFQRVHEGIAAYTFVIRQIQSPGLIPLDYLCLFTHADECVKHHGTYSSTHTIVEAR